MIRHDSRNYRIEEFSNTPLRFALDYKEQEQRADGVWTHFKNIGWFKCYEHACKAMADHVIERHMRGEA